MSFNMWLDSVNFIITKIMNMQEAKGKFLHYMATDRSFNGGVALYQQYGSNPYVKRRFNLLKPSESSTKDVQQILARELGVNDALFHHLMILPLGHPHLDKYRMKKVSKRKPRKKVENLKNASFTEAEKKNLSLREQFPFLDDPNLSPDFKILVADMISSYRKASTGHSALFDNKDNDSLFFDGKVVIENYVNNQLIYRELEYYQEHGEILGEHPHFKLKNEREELSAKTSLQLGKEKEKIERRIAENKSKIAFGDRPDLEDKREAKIKELQYLLSVIVSILKARNEL